MEKFIQEGVELSISRFYKSQFDILGDVKKGTLEIGQSCVVFFSLSTRKMGLKLEVQDPWIFMVTVRFQNEETMEIFLDPDFNIFWTVPHSKELCKFCFENGAKVEIRPVSINELNLIF